MSAPLELFVPGRMCMLGEHSDWAGQHTRDAAVSCGAGCAIIFGTAQGFHARVEAQDDNIFRMTATDNHGVQRSLQLPLAADELLKVAFDEESFWSYVAGTVFCMATEFEVAGLRIEQYRSDLPARKGLSSSAAVCVLVADAFNRVYNLKLSTRGLMEYAFRGETLTGSRCGRMDQACAFGCRPVVLTFDGVLVHTRPLALKCDLHFVIVDLRADKDTRTILKALQGTFCAAEESEARAQLRQFLGRYNRDSCERATRAMAEGDAAALGRLFTEWQKHFDAHAAPLCPSQLTAPKLHAVLQHPGITDHVFGGKGVGSQGDGVAQLLCRSQTAMQAVCTALEESLDVKCMPMSLPARDG